MKITFQLVFDWETPTRYNKYGRPKTMRELMYFFIEHHCQYKHGRRDTTQPFKFIIDSRFSSLDVLRKMDEHGFYALMTCSSRMKPQQLLKWMSKDLPIRSWRVVYHHHKP